MGLIVAIERCRTVSKQQEEKGTHKLFPRFLGKVQRANGLGGLEVCWEGWGWGVDLHHGPF